MVAKPLYYDWRKQISDTFPLLIDFINANVVPNEKVDIVGHSMGGLIGRAYIEAERWNNKADKLMTVGTPHQGTLLAYPAWSAGEAWGSLLWKIASTIVLKNCPNAGMSDRETIQHFIPSVQNLLPTFNYIKDKKTGEIKPATGMSAQNNWPRDEFMSNFNTTIGALSGYGFDTLQFFDINSKDKPTGNGNWADGKPVKSEYFLEGDGTVLKDSSTLLNYDNDYISQDHSGLIASTEGINVILRFLSTGSTTALPQIQSTYVEPKSALIIIGDPADFWVLDPDGKLMKEKESVIGFLNPKPGSYRLVLLPKTASTRIEVGQFLENGQIFWKEYKHEGRLPKIGTVNFNPDNPLEDALR